MAFGTKMGIKFTCPNGHKLHVKTFLSGKRAICPKCGARVVVPAESSVAVVGDAAPETSPTESVEIPLEGSLIDNALEALSTEGLSVTQEPAKPPPPPRPPAADPLEEAPGAVWYVRPAGGGQYGPASAEIMRGWLADGRVGGNALVWRAGWTEWCSAATIFPQLGPATAPPAVPGVGVEAGGTANGTPPLPVGHAVSSLGPAPPEVEPPSMEPLAQQALRRRRKKDVRLIASAILAAVSLILVIVLVLVSRGQSDEPEPKSEEPAAASEEALI